jgi:Iap family predicted aminopeptidase
MVYCLNNDNGSYTDTTIVSIPGLSKINTESIIKEACSGFGLTATDDFPEANMLYSASDNVHFSKIGIPSVTYSLGFTSFNAEIREYYHQPKDEAESIDYNYLYKFCGGYNLSLRLIGNMSEQPFWKEGEEYYDTGKKLYDN